MYGRLKENVRAFTFNPTKRRKFFSLRFFIKFHNCCKDWRKVVFLTQTNILIKKSAMITVVGWCPFANNLRNESQQVLTGLFLTRWLLRLVSSIITDFPSKFL